MLNGRPRRRGIGKDSFEKEQTVMRYPLLSCRSFRLQVRPNLAVLRTVCLPGSRSARLPLTGQTWPQSSLNGDSFTNEWPFNATNVYIFPPSDLQFSVCTQSVRSHPFLPLWRLWVFYWWDFFLCPAWFNVSMKRANMTNLLLRRSARNWAKTTLYSRWWGALSSWLPMASKVSVSPPLWRNVLAHCFYRSSRTRGFGSILIQQAGHFCSLCSLHACGRSGYARLLRVTH